MIISKPTQIKSIETTFYHYDIADGVEINFRIVEKPEYLVQKKSGRRVTLTFIPAECVRRVVYADGSEVTAESGSALVECALLVAIVALVLAFPFIIGVRYETRRPNNDARSKNTVFHQRRYQVHTNSQNARHES